MSDFDQVPAGGERRSPFEGSATRPAAARPAPAAQDVAASGIFANNDAPATRNRNRDPATRGQLALLEEMLATRSWTDPRSGETKPFARAEGGLDAELVAEYIGTITPYREPVEPSELTVSECEDIINYVKGTPQKNTVVFDDAFTARVRQHLGLSDQKRKDGLFRFFRRDHDAWGHEVGG